MRTLAACCLLLAATGSWAAGQAVRTFTTRDHVIEMVMEYSAKYAGKPLLLRDSHSGKEICVAADGISGRCMDRFVGAVVLVRYSIRRRDGTIPPGAVVREYVTTVEQSPGLPDRPPFATTQPVVDGWMSDIQVFGYDESSLSRAERAQAARENGRFFRSYRQELYVNDDAKPFAVVEWRHTFDRISIMRVDSTAAE